MDLMITQIPAQILQDKSDKKFGDKNSIEWKKKWLQGFRDVENEERVLNTKVDILSTRLANLKIQEEEKKIEKVSIVDYTTPMMAVYMQTFPSIPPDVISRVLVYSDHDYTKTYKLLSKIFVFQKNTPQDSALTIFNRMTVFDTPSSPIFKTSLPVNNNSNSIRKYDLDYSEDSHSM